VTRLDRDDRRGRRDVGRIADVEQLTRVGVDPLVLQGERRLDEDGLADVVAPKSTFGAEIAFEPSAFLRKATWAFSSEVVRLRKA